MIHEGSSRNILVLGAGLVAKPLVQYFLERPVYQVIVASRGVKKAENLIAEHPRGRTLALDAQHDKAGLKNALGEADLAISLLPASHHVEVARLCLETNTHLVTTSYVSPEMAGLDEKAREKGLLFLNEIGLDPGIDHMTAMKIFDEIREKNGSVTIFLSNCGGLPAPEANNNPFGYKFSWSPLGVLMAMRNGALYLRDGREVAVPPGELFNCCDRISISGLGEFEVYPNRDSLKYREVYGISEVSTIIRGTIRNQGHCDTWKNMVQLGLLDIDKILDLSGKTYRSFLGELSGFTEETLEQEISARLNLAEDSPFIPKLQWLGLTERQRIPLSKGGALDVLARRLFEKLCFDEGERDMIILEHDIIAEYPASGEKERIVSTLIDYGIPGGDSAMARTVSLPAAIASRLILEGKISLRGVRIPTERQIYDPVIEELKELGISFEERHESLARAR